jgi:glutamine synthetase
MEKLGCEDVLRIIVDKKIKFIRIWFTDILGVLKSFAITVEELEGALEEGMALTAHPSRDLPVSTKAT